MSNQRRPGGDEPPRPSGKRKRRSRRWLGYLLLIGLGMTLGLAGMAASYVYQAYQTLPAFEEFDPSQTSVILDREGSVVYRLAAEENRTTIKDINQIPQEVRLAFVATEDRRFYDHKGIDLYRVGGAVLQDVKYFLGVEGTQLEGASTITMQLARNAFLTLDQNVNRKLQEMMIALQLERQYTKDEILLMYLNQVSFGAQAYGLEAASQTYFSKSASELTLSEAAMLAGILKAPSAYNPLENYEGAMNRRAIVLSLMAKYGFISEERAAALKQEQVELKPAEVLPTTVTFTGDWYVDYVVNILTDAETAKRYGIQPIPSQDLYHKGLKIHTALDLESQRVAEQKLQEIMPAATQQFGGKNAEVPQGAVVVMDHTTGEVKALVGGLKHEHMLGYNRATQAYRQPGSAIKPIVAYLPAIDYLGWGPGTVIDDSPIRLNDDGSDVWPVNYNRAPYLGLRPMRYGVEQSLNTMAVRALNAVTPAKAIDYAHSFGLTSIVDETNPSPNDAGLALALGGLTKGVTVLDLTAAYGALGNLGLKMEPVVITKIEDNHGKVLFEAKTKQKRTQLVPKESAYLMVDILKGAVRRGTPAYETKGFKGWPAGGKTGTTEDWHDAWFVGFTPTLVTGVWTGYDNDTGRKALPGNWTGAGPPTRIWTAIMTELVKERPEDWPRPAGITEVQICQTSGLLPSPLCPKEDLVVELFRKGTEPKELDNVWTQATVVKQAPAEEGGVERYVLWQKGCVGTPETRLFIKRPNTYAKHPKDPNNTRYWPADWEKELPTQTCTPQTSPSSTAPPWLQTPGGTTPSTGTQPPAGTAPSTGTQPGTGASGGKPSSGNNPGGQTGTGQNGSQTPSNGGGAQPPPILPGM